MKAHFSVHNRKILKNDENVAEGCNCRPSNKDPCPLDGECLTESVVYKATVSTNQPNMNERTYHGMTENSFKERWYGHRSDFKHEEKYGTALSRYVWKLKNMKSSLPDSRKKNFKWNIKWEIKEKAPVYQPGSIDCKLCIAEKFHILDENYRKSLNVRSELLSKCRHKYKWKLGRLLS